MMGESIERQEQETHLSDKILKTFHNMKLIYSYRSCTSLIKHYAKEMYRGSGGSEWNILNLIILYFSILLHCIVQ
jgi:hypothetical protein